MTGDINRLPGDMLRNIMGRLPAKSFALASCVSKTWYRVSTQILPHPKLATALSTNPSLTDAVQEVLEKVLCKPIRPHFAIACTSEKDGLGTVHQLIRETLGAATPLVTHISHGGVMGMDALTDEIREVQWENFNDIGLNDPLRDHRPNANRGNGIVLVVGYLPGIKVDAIPCCHPRWDNIPIPRFGIIDPARYIQQINDFTASVSNDQYPKAIMMFGDIHSPVNSIVEKLNDSMPMEATAIVGDSGGCFMFNSLNYTINYREEAYTLDAVALVFATDRNKSPDVGSTEFHVAMAGGLIPFGPKFDVLTAGITHPETSFWLCVALEGRHQDVRIVMDTIMQADALHSELYLGVVTQERAGGRERSVTPMSFYKLLGYSMGSEDIIFIDGIGARPGDSFTFHKKDLETARTTNVNTRNILQILKDKTCGDGGELMKGVFGGLIFSSHTRGESYFGEPNVDVHPFSQNFPGIPVAGVFCRGEIGHGQIIEHGYQQHCPQISSRRACSAVYMVMSYAPPPIPLDQ